MADTRGEEITEFMVTSLKEGGFEDTPENRLAFLTGLKQAWDEDTDSSIEKSLYMLALTMLLMLARMKVRTG